MSGKTTPFKVNLTGDERSQIEAAQKAAGYKSLSAYMRDGALSNGPVHLLTIAREMGKLGQIANDILAAGDAASGTGGLYGSDARKAARRIIKACDAVTAALRADRAMRPYVKFHANASIVVKYLDKPDAHPVGGTMPYLGYRDLTKRFKALGHHATSEPFMHLTCQEV